jgi:hypothetical protein
LYIQGNIPHACSFRPDFAELLYRSPGPAVIPSAAGVHSVRRFCGYRSASEASAVSFCDHPQGWRSVASAGSRHWISNRLRRNEPAHSSVPRKPPFGHGILVRSPLLFTKTARIYSEKMKNLSLLECALTQKGGRGVPAYFTLQSTSFFVSLEPRCHNASFGVAIASTRKACGKGRRHGQS